MAAARIFLPKTNELLLGRCLPCLKHYASKIRVQKFEFDEKLLQHFPVQFIFYAYDPNKICKSGDTVLIRELQEKKFKLITHEVIEVVYPLGDVTDPLTGRKIVGTEFRDVLNQIDSLYGQTEPNFDYDKAPKRGWQQDKRDFSHREFYRRYHEFEKGDENENQPYSTLVN